MALNKRHKTVVKPFQDQLALQQDQDLNNLQVWGGKRQISFNVRNVDNALETTSGRSLTNIINEDSPKTLP